MNVKLPSGVAVALAAISGVVVAFLASGVIALEAPWSNDVQVGLTILAVWGISPLTGPAFRAWLHLSNGAALLVGTTLATLQVIVQQIHGGGVLHGVLAGIIATAAGLGFAPANESDVVA